MWKPKIIQKITDSMYVDEYEDVYDDEFDEQSHHQESAQHQEHSLDDSAYSTHSPGVHGQQAIHNDGFNPHPPTHN